MSPLDQAIIKAYAKDRSVANPPAGGNAVTASLARPAAGHAIDQVYYDGRLYRSGAPTTATPTTATPTSTVPAPHVAGLPPTSPRRSARRTLLRRLAAAPPSPPAVEPAPAPPRVARKVMIRHVSHVAVPPAPLGLARPAIAPPAPLGLAQPRSMPPAPPKFSNSSGRALPHVELPPETIAQPPQPASPAPLAAPAVPVTPATPAPPATAPLNMALAMPASVEVCLPWDNTAAISAAAVLVETAPAPADRPWQVVTVALDALAEIERTASRRAAPPSDKPAAPSEPPAAASEKPAAPFAAKALSDREDRGTQFRCDAPHASGRHRPHVRFFPPTAAATTVKADEPRAAAVLLAEAAPVAERAPQPPIEPHSPRAGQSVIAEPAAIAQPATVAEPVTVLESPLLARALARETDIAPLSVEELTADELTVEDLTFAEPLVEVETVAPPVLDQPLASDLIPHETDEEWPLAAETETTAALATDELPARSAVPQWEVDAFQWPRTCQKLMADEQGYLARAGDKLLAAVQDGLRVLAITGSRRGEGRTTLALCLARAAAGAGVQTAIMDCDFSRPQLASKIGLEVAHGWQDAALGKVPLSEAAVKSLRDNITVLPLESSAAARTISLADPRVTATIRAAAATFELVILDLGPLAAGESLAFPPGEKCPLDAALVVRDLRFATSAEAQAVGHALHGVGLEAVGIAENFVIEEEIPATSV